MLTYKIAPHISFKIYSDSNVIKSETQYCSSQTIGGGYIKTRLVLNRYVCYICSIGVINLYEYIKL